ncbi:MAG: bifunctional phosphoribosylaminoimidazolecarboxamide formyltransferase/IMP cyclohydrolase PurH [Candidatus Zixiibacteriota bacterium]|nr:MAG: bifunctional phosphoribosylaminoimidazolecarboxamide formyltransferase/IMP cyclohydrolase PurH [candidate division Zixibacteria bacterium]
MPVTRALLSVYDKTGIIEFARDLARLGIAIISTGGTSRTLQEAGIPHQPVEAVTGFPEMLEGRVKTLHPLVHGGILFRRDREDDVAKTREFGIGPIDLVCVNLYPFARTAADPAAQPEDVIEMIDIGGPAMLRSAAKNFRWVLPVCRPARYGEIIAALEAGEPDSGLRRQLAAETFAHTAEYDAAVAAWMVGRPAEGLPERLTLQFRRHQALRYGENPHQQAAFYLPGMAAVPYEQLGGKELSYNNLLDLEGAIGLAQEFTEPAVALIKHTVPCGAAVGGDLVETYRRAFATDTSSPFGGIVGVNRTVTADLARELAEVFYEVIVAPDYEPEALEILRRKKNLRLIRLLEPLGQGIEMRSAAGGLLAQERDRVSPRGESWKVATVRRPAPEEWAGLEFAWKVVRWAKSNAVVFADDRQTLGVGLGQTSRVDAVELAVARSAKYGTSLQGSVLASDAFFPFPDGAEAAISAGATAIIQPGGSVRDAEVVEACDRLGVAMVFTGERHFRH